jgi:hypothetical protein
MKVQWQVSLPQIVWWMGELSSNIRARSSALAWPCIEHLGVSICDLFLGLSADIDNDSANQSFTTQFEEDPNNCHATLDSVAAHRQI